MAGQERSGRLSDREFETVRGALMATAKGRAFLFEWVERTRADDTRTLFSALERIEENLTLVRDTLKPGAIADDLRRIAQRLDAISGDGRPATRKTRVRIARRELESISNEINMLASALESESENLTGRPTAARDTTPHQASDDR